MSFGCKPFVEYLHFCTFTCILLGEIVATAERKALEDGTMEEKAALYSTPQPPSSDFGCVTMTYSGENVKLNVFISQGTVLTNDMSVLQRQNIDSKIFVTTSFQTPIAIPYMVRLDVKQM
jgi:hypothetical protein